jgi:uncharacterized coiled-coil protein SlyX
VAAPPEEIPPPIAAPAPEPAAEIPAPRGDSPLAAPEPVAEVEAPAPGPEIGESNDAAEAELAMTAARIKELQAVLREQQRRTEESEAKLAELAADAEARRESGGEPPAPPHPVSPAWLLEA